MNGFMRLGQSYPVEQLMLDEPRVHAHVRLTHSNEVHMSEMKNWLPISACGLAHTTARAGVPLTRSICSSARSRGRTVQEGSGRYKIQEHRQFVHSTSIALILR